MTTTDTQTPPPSPDDVRLRMLEQIQVIRESLAQVQTLLEPEPPAD
jgi:hypothetical protein